MGDSHVIASVDSTEEEIYSKNYFVQYPVTKQWQLDYHSPWPDRGFYQVALQHAAVQLPLLVYPRYLVKCKCSFVAGYNC